VVVASADGTDPALLGLEGVTILPLRRRGPASLAATFGLHTGIRGVLRGRPGAVVHAFGSMPSYLTIASLIAARLNRHPVVWTPMFHPLRARVWRLRLLLRLMLVFDRLVPQLARLVDVVGAATDAEASAFEKHARRVEMLPPVVELVPVLTEAEADAFREEAGVGASPLTVVVASRDEPRKGLDFAWAALERLRRDMPTARLLVLGLPKPPRGLPPGAVWLGHIDDATLTRALHAADVVFVPSLFEAFSRVVIEAWRQETPVVVSDGVALAPVVQQAGGRPVPYGDAEAAAEELGRALRDRDDARAQGLAGGGFVRERFLLDVLLDRIEELYQELPGRETARAPASRSARVA
jgi:glycosyltransferase involved in cell wall biosynthesis